MQDFDEVAFQAFLEGMGDRYDFREKRSGRQKGRMCTSQKYITLGGKRTKVCCAQGLCTTKYGIVVPE
jgi:hypothetical protein